MPGILHAVNDRVGHLKGHRDPRIGGSACAQQNGNSSVPLSHARRVVRRGQARGTNIPGARALEPPRQASLNLTDWVAQSA